MGAVVGSRRGPRCRVSSGDLTPTDSLSPSFWEKGFQGVADADPPKGRASWSPPVHPEIATSPASGGLLAMTTTEGLSGKKNAEQRRLLHRLH